MKEINEIKIPEGVDRIAVKQHDDRIVFKFIPEKPKFKTGDKVRIKKGVNIGTNKCDELILTVDAYYEQYRNILYCKGFPYLFHEDWLEPYAEEPKKGDLAIFWDYSKAGASIGLYDEKFNERHYDSSDTYWVNAIKFESKEQFEKILRGEI